MNMNRTQGTIARGIRTPIVKEGDNLVDIVFHSIALAVESDKIEL